MVYLRSAAKRFQPNLTKFDNLMSCNSAHSDSNNLNVNILVMLINMRNLKITKELLCQLTGARQ